MVRARIIYTLCRMMMYYEYLEAKNPPRGSDPSSCQGGSNERIVLVLQGKSESNPGASAAGLGEMLQVVVTLEKCPVGTVCHFQWLCLSNILGLVQMS